MDKSKQVIVVVGKVCAGKSTFAEYLLHHNTIDIGSIVRGIMKSELRIHDKNLDQEIIRHLDYGMRVQFGGEKVVITGIRQLSILRHIIENYSKEERELIWLDVPQEELKRRYMNRTALKDQSITFEEVIERDGKLGLNEVEQFIEQNQSLFTIIKNY